MLLLAADFSSQTARLAVRPRLKELPESRAGAIANSVLLIFLAVVSEVPVIGPEERDRVCRESSR